MPHPKRPVANALLVVALWIAFYASFPLFSPALLDDADSVHAEVAREMLLRHDWVTLYANGIRYLEKAPLLYWSMAAGFRLFGVSAAAARLPLALAVLALAFAVESFARRAFGSIHAGLYAALILLSSPGLFLFTRVLLPDAMLCLWLTLSLLAFWLTEELGAQNPVPHSSQPHRDEWDTITEPVPPTAEHKCNEVVILSAAKDPDEARPVSTARTFLPLEHFPDCSRDFNDCHSERSEESPHLARCASLYPMGENTLTPSLRLRLLCYAFAACCALGVLTKGLIGAVFPLAIVAIYLLLTRGPRAACARIRQLHPLSSLAVFLAIATPWHILIALANPAQGHPGALVFAHHRWLVPLPTQGNVHGWLWFYFVNEQLLRYLDLRVPRDYDTVPLWLFWSLCLLWLAPWSAFLFRAIRWRNPLSHTLPEFFRKRRVSAPLLLLLWALVPLLFFSLSTRQEYYVLPSLPALAILIASWLAQDRDGRPLPLPAKKICRANLRATAILVALGATFSAAALVFLLHSHAPAPNADLAALLQQNPADYALSMGHFLDLNARALELFRLPLALAAAALLVGPLASSLLRRRNQPHAATLALATAAFAFLLAVHLSLQTFAPVLSSQQLAADLAPQLQSQDLLVIHQEYEFASTLGFYLRRPGYIEQNGRPIAVNPIHILTDPAYKGVADYGRSSNLWYGSFFPDAPAIFETPQSLAKEWSGPRRIFLWQDLSNQPSPLPALSGPVYLIARSGGKQIVSNQLTRP